MLFGKTYGSVQKYNIAFGYWLTDLCQIVPFTDEADIDKSALTQIALRKLQDSYTKACDEADISPSMFVMQFLGWIRVWCDGGTVQGVFFSHRVAARAYNAFGAWDNTKRAETEMTGYSFQYYTTPTASSMIGLHSQPEALTLLRKNIVKQVMKPALIEAARKRIAAFVKTMASPDFKPESLLRRLESSIGLYLKPGNEGEKQAAGAAIERLLKKAEENLSTFSNPKERQKFIDDLQRQVNRVPKAGQKAPPEDFTRQHQKPSSSPPPKSGVQKFHLSQIVFDKNNGMFCMILEYKGYGTYTVRHIISSILRFGPIKFVSDSVLRPLANAEESRQAETLLHKIQKGEQPENANEEDPDDVKDESDDAGDYDHVEPHIFKKGDWALDVITVASRAYCKILNTPANGTCTVKHVFERPKLEIGQSVKVPILRLHRLQTVDIAPLTALLKKLNVKW